MCRVLTGYSPISFRWENEFVNPDDATGLPLLSTWRGVYIFVLVIFVLMVALLTALTFGYR